MGWFKSSLYIALIWGGAPFQNPFTLAPGLGRSRFEPVHADPRRGHHEHSEALTLWIWALVVWGLGFSDPKP